MLALQLSEQNCQDLNHPECHGLSLQFGEYQESGRPRYARSSFRSLGRRGRAGNPVRSSGPCQPSSPPVPDSSLLSATPLTCLRNLRFGLTPGELRPPRILKDGVRIVFLSGSQFALPPFLDSERDRS